MSGTKRSAAPDDIKRGGLAALGFLVVVGAGLRLYRLNAGLWFDEIVTLLTSVRPPLVEILSQFPGNNDHPLYSVLAHLSVVALGEEPWTLRLPSALFGVATIPALYLLSTAVTSKVEGLLATSILTVSYHHIWFSQNGRGYTLLLLCVLLATYALVLWLARGRTVHAVAYAVAAALGAYTHLTMVFVCAAHFLICAFALSRRSGCSGARAEWKGMAVAFGGAGALTVLLYAPKLADVQKFFGTPNVTGAEVATPMWALWEALQGLQLGFGTIWGLAIGGLICGAGAWSYFKQDAAALLLFILPVPLTLGIAVALGRPIFPRFVFFAIGFGLLITVRGAMALGRWTGERLANTMAPARAGMLAASVLTIGAVALSVRSLPYGYRFPKQDYTAAVAFVEQRKQTQDSVAVVGVTSAVPVRDYLGKSWPRVDRERELNELRMQGHDVWVIFTFPSYIAVDQPELLTILERGCVEVARFEGTVAGGAIAVARCAPTGI